MAQAQQPKNLEEALQVIQQQNELINQLKVALQLQQHRQFAKKNESLNPDQLSLFEEKRVGVTDSEEPSDAAVEKRESSRHPKPKKNNSRKENLDRIVIQTVVISWLPPRRRVRCLITAISQAASWQRLRLTNLIWLCRLIVRNACGKQLILNWIPSRWQMR